MYKDTKSGYPLQFLNSPSFNSFPTQTSHNSSVPKRWKSVDTDWIASPFISGSPTRVSLVLFRCNEVFGPLLRSVYLDRYLCLSILVERVVTVYLTSPPEEDRDEWRRPLDGLCSESITLVFVESRDQKPRSKTTSSWNQ